MKTTATNKKIRELVKAVIDGALVPRPEFQRRLVWTMEDKNRFLDSVLRGFPFPEIYVADGEINTSTAEGTQLLVDGQQRITTLKEYFLGEQSLRLITVPAFSDLDEDAQKAFLGYDVAVRDLGDVSREQILEVFKRINSTSYSLNDMEINNAIYAGKLKQFGDSICAFPFFEAHGVFNATDLKRMGDLRYLLTVALTMLMGYFNRDDELENALGQYNDDFPYASDLRKRLDKVLSFIDECGFGKKSRIWKKADLFTLLVELDRFFVETNRELQPGDVLDVLERFFAEVDAEQDTGGSASAISIYYKAALQASNDRLNRIRRGLIIAALLRGEDPHDAVSRLA